MKSDAAVEREKGSNFQKEAKRMNTVVAENSELENVVDEALEGSAGSKTTSIQRANKNKIPTGGSDDENVDEMPVEKASEYENRNNALEEAVVCPSPTSDEIYADCFNVNIGESAKTTELGDVIDLNSYSTGSVQTIGSDDEVQNLSDVEHQVGDIDSETEPQASPKTSEASFKSLGTGSNTSEASSKLSKANSKSSEASSKSLASKSSNESFTDESFTQKSNEAVEKDFKISTLAPKLSPPNKVLDESPKAISLISCSDDSFTPIRRSGKKRPNMFEDSDSDTAEQNNGAKNQSQQSSDSEEALDAHFKRNQERKAKRAKQEAEQEEEHCSSPATIKKEYKSRSFVSDFDQMMQKRRNEKSKPHTGRRLDFITKNDDLIDQLIDQMEDAAYEDRCLNEQGLPATKKVAMLKLVTSQLIKKDLQPLFLEHNILGTLAEWLSPLPSKCLPCLQIRECILHILEDLPAINATLLKESGIGKTLMFLCKHPEETKKNRECCRRLIAQWARPIYNLTCDYRAMSKAERQERDIEISTRHKRKVADKSSAIKVRQPVRELEDALCGEQATQALRPGDHGWVPRARVPQPSTKDYVHRPQSLLNCQLSNRLKRLPNRYEALAKKHQNAKRAKGSAQHSKVGLSIFGNKV